MLNTVFCRQLAASPQRGVEAGLGKLLFVAALTQRIQWSLMRSRRGGFAAVLAAKGCVVSDLRQTREAAVL